jgi:hypothetical protein
MTCLYRLTLHKGGNLAKKEIRLQYSGFVIFAAKLLSIATGLAFQFPNYYAVKIREHRFV